MTTPNGQHDLEPNGSSTQATSTVLALDGWGPVIAEPASNGTNGSEPEVVVEPVPQMEAPQPQRARRDRVVADLQDKLTRLEVDQQVVRILVPALAMAMAMGIAIFAGLKLGSLYQWPSEATPMASPPSGAEVLRRRIALAIDPTLTAVEPERRGLLDWIR